MSDANRQIVTTLYEAFGRLDGAAMAACYAPDATFSDPVFPDLRDGRAGNMWRMLTAQARDLRIEFSDVQADDGAGSAHWEAWYTFGTGRPVHNVIDAEFTFRDGLIASHVDRFDLWKWTRMALGLPGALLGWSPLLQNQVRAQAGKSLRAWEAENA